MTAICIDDEKLLLDSLLRAVKASADIREAKGFTDEYDALFWAEGHAFDLVFLDIELHDTNGITVAETLREINPDCGIIYCTGFPGYALKAIGHHVVDGYLLKPVTAGDVQKEIDNYKNRHHIDHLLLAKDSGNGFSFFDRRGNLLVFRRGKTGELLSALIKSGGAEISTTELCRLLWEDSDMFLEKNKSYLWQLVLDLKNALREAGAEELLIKTGDGYAIKANAVKQETGNGSL